MFGPATYTVTIEVKYEADTVGKHPLKAGLTANVDITTRGVEKRLAVPAAALQFRPDPMPTADQAQLDSSSADGLAPLWLWQGGKMHLVFVKRGAADGQWVEILNTDADWAKPGTLVVIEGPPPPEPMTFFGAKGISLR
jgi:multidrug efflux pump subunit AcrA (membrane-fusion protein)